MTPADQDRHLLFETPRTVRQESGKAHRGVIPLQPHADVPRAERGHAIAAGRIEANRDI
jgi:hypothetical protein